MLSRLKYDDLTGMIKFASWASLIALVYAIPFYFSWGIFVSQIWVGLLTVFILAFWIPAIYFLPSVFGSKIEDSAALERHDPIKLVWILIAMGIALRVAYFLVVYPWPLIADEASYITVANSLLETGKYSFEYKDGDNTSELLAWRPPGYPFFLVALFWVFGSHVSVIFFAHLVAFVATCFVTYSLARDLFGSKAGVIAVALLSTWPTLIFSTGIGLSEPLALLIYTTLIWSLFRMTKSNTGWLRYAVLCGVLIGFGALVKPPFLLLPSAWFVYLLIAKEKKLALASKMIVVGLIAAAVIAPWTFRNYVVLDAFVPISTNGGDNFYRANNPVATGGYTPASERNLDVYLPDEVYWNSKGYEWGIEWIRSDPVGFIVLALHKQRIFLGADESGTYYTYARFVADNPQASVWAKFTRRLSLAASNGWWLCLWVLIGASLLRHRQFWRQNPEANFLLWTVLFLVVVHSVFESLPRHHITLGGVLTILAAASMVNRQPAIGNASD